MPVSEDEGRVCGRAGQEAGSDGVLALVLSTGSAERAEGRGVGAAFGGEMAAEAEHVRPGGQAELFELGEFAEAQAFGDQAAGVLADREVGEAGGRVDALVEGAGAFGGFGGVFGHVGGEIAANAALHSHSALPGGQFTVSAELSPSDYVWIEVEDQGGFWTPAAAEPGGGHGLDIIHALATDWGIDGDYRTRTVWVRFDWPPDTPPPAPIPAGTGRRQSACDGGESATADPSPAPILASARTTRPAGQWTAVLDGERLRHLRFPGAPSARWG